MENLNFSNNKLFNNSTIVSLSSDIVKPKPSIIQHLSSLLGFATVNQICQVYQITYIQTAIQKVKRALKLHKRLEWMRVSESEVKQLPKKVIKLVVTSAKKLRSLLVKVKATADKPEPNIIRQFPFEGASQLSNGSINTLPIGNYKESASYKALYQEWVIESGVPVGYFDELIKNGFLFFNIPDTTLAKLLFQDATKQKSAIWRAEQLRGCWGFRSYAPTGENQFKQLDTKCQIKVPKAQQLKLQKIYDDKFAKEGGKHNTAHKYQTTEGSVAPIQVMPIANRHDPLVLANPHAYEKHGSLSPDKLLTHCHDVPIIVIEGGKKGAILAAYGFIVIVLPGVWMGNKKGEYNRKELIEAIEQFAVKGRQFYICFDNDPIEKADTRKSVGQALHELTRNLQFKTGVEPKVITWEQYPEKGADDLIAARGIEVFYKAYENAIPFMMWEALYFTRIFGKPDLEFNKGTVPESEKYFPKKIVVPKNVTKCSLEGAFGLGKTEVMASFTNENDKQALYTIVLVNLDTLKNQLANRLNLNTIEELWNNEADKTKNKGCVACIDSIGKVFAWLDSQGLLESCQFRLMIDEADQVLKHLLWSSTHVKRSRGENINKLVELIKLCDRVTVADADLTRLTWDYLNLIKGGVGFRIVNHYKYSRDVIWWNGSTPHSMIELGIIKAAESCKGAILVTTQGGEDSSTWGAESIADELREKLEALGIDREIIVLTADTLGEPNSKVFGIFDSKSKFHQFLKRCEDNNAILIFSPVMKTGFSIDADFDFKYQFSIFQGVGCPQDGIQQMHRARKEDIERHIWVNNRGVGSDVGNGGKTNKAIKAGINYQEKSELSALEDLGVEVETLTHDAITEGFYSLQAALYNLSRKNYKSWFLGLLKYKWNYNLISSDDWLKAKTVTIDNAEQLINSELIFNREELDDYAASSKESINKIRERVKEKDDLFYQQAVDVPLLTQKEYEDKRNDKKRLSRLERQKQIKAGFYYNSGGTLPLTPLTLKNYKEDNYLGKLELHHALFNQNLLVQRDSMSIERSSKFKRIFRPDTFKKTIAKDVKYLCSIGFSDFLLELSEACINPTKDKLFQYIKIGESLQDQEKFPPDQNNLNNAIKGTGAKIEIDPNSPAWVELCNKLRANGGWTCKNALGFTPAPKQNSSVIASLLGLVGLDLIAEGKGRKYRYFLAGYDDGRENYFDYLQERSHQTLLDPENTKTLEFLTKKLESGDCVTSYVKNAVKALATEPINGLMTLADLVALGANLPDAPVPEDISDWKDIIFNSITEAVGTRDYWQVCNAYDDIQGLLIPGDLNQEQGEFNATINKFLAYAVKKNKVDILLLQKKQTQWEFGDRQLIPVTTEPFTPLQRPKPETPETIWQKLKAACNPCVDVIEKIRANTPASMEFAQQCNDLWTRYSSQFEEWVSRNLINVEELSTLKACSNYYAQIA